MGVVFRKIDMDLPAGTVRERFVFEGRVQGVGFRFTAKGFANRYHVTGWAENEDDGTVCAEMQGLPEDIEAVLAGLNRTEPIRIDSMTRERIDINPKEKSFLMG